jgi:hypothetical protein
MLVLAGAVEVVNALETAGGVGPTEAGGRKLPLLLPLLLRLVHTRAETVVRRLGVGVGWDR